MKNDFLLLTAALPGLLIAFPGFAAESEIKQRNTDKSTEVISDIPSLSEIELPAINAELLTQQSAPSEVNPETQPETEPDYTDDADIFIEAIGEKDNLPQSTPTYVIDKEEIQKQGATSLADILKRMPGFAINDVGHGADTHTGTYYRGASINQSVFLINGRPINNNVNTYHGGTDLNSIPVEAIERVELYSGMAG